MRWGATPTIMFNLRDDEDNKFGWNNEHMCYKCADRAEFYIFKSWEYSQDNIIKPQKMRITVNTQNTEDKYCTIVSRLLLDRSMNTVYGTTTGQVKDIKIPRSVRQINENAFKGHQKIQSVILGSDT